MRKSVLLSAMLATTISPLAQAADDDDSIRNSLVASVRIGLTLEDGGASDNDIFVRNFGSRIKWSGERDFDSGLTAIGYLEFGLNPDDNSRGSSGIDRTRHSWAGLKGGFGSVKIGAQYAAFYDMVSGHTDIAWWGSCFQQFECGRETQILKYSGGSGPLSYAASIQAQSSDEDEDIADEIELGVNYALGDITLGFATSIQADDGADDGGTLIGGVVKGNAGPVALGLGYQRADKEFVDGVHAFTHVTLTASYLNGYAVYNQGDSGSNEPSFFTLGYAMDIGPGTLMYFEYQNLDGDIPGEDDATILRATFKYDFGIL